MRKKKSKWKRGIKRNIEGKSNPFKRKQELKVPVVCKMCRAVYIDGAWTWTDEPENADEIICPACQRYEENQPAGIIDIKGTIFKNHKTDLLDLITNLEKIENKDHPMERIMSISNKKDHMVVTTTGVILARRIAELLRKSFDGELVLNFQEPNDRLDVILKD